MDIEKSVKSLLTPDGIGSIKKAGILIELCETANANIVRETIKKLVKDKKIF